MEYRPFAGLQSTLSLRDGRCHVRLSDLLANAPPLVLEALAEILLSRASRRRPSREARECYLAYVFAPAVRRRIDLARRARSSKRLLPPQGRFYDLEKICAKLNHRYFRDRLKLPRLGWSHRRSRIVLGHYDSAHETIMISRRLDSPSVPRVLVEYVVFHEMLHIEFPLERRGARRIVHSRAFRAAEKRFPGYDRARRKLKRALLY